MTTLLVSLIGEQPTPNLLPIYVLKPSHVLLLTTAQTQSVSERLREVLKKRDVHVNTLQVQPYDVERNAEFTRQALDKLKPIESIWFNITSGTKPMMLAILQVAREIQSSELCYYRTERSQGILYAYRSSTLQTTRVEPVEETIPLDDYLRSYLGDYNVTGPSLGKGGIFEQAVYQALEPYVDELLLGLKKGGALDIDLIIRCGNQVGIAEIKTGRKARTKEGIDQLTTAGAREYLGTYIKKFLIVDSSWDVLTNLKELTKAHGIGLVELPSYGSQGGISETDKEKLVQAVRSNLLCER